MARPLSESNSAIKIALIFLLIVLILFLVGFSTPHWVVRSDLGLGVISSGLWETCVDYFVGYICTANSILEGDSSASIIKALLCVGLVGLVLSTVGTVMNIFCVRSRSLKQAVVFILIMSGISILAGCAYYVIKTDIRYLGYSYSLCCVGGCGAFFVAVLLCIDVRREQDPHPEQSVMYNPSQPAAVYSLPSGPYGGQVLSPPPPGPQGYVGQASPQYTSQGYTDKPSKS